MMSRYIVIGLLAVHAALLLDGARKNFVTVDEVGHIAAGISHWETGRFFSYRVNPPLPRMLAVIPVLAAEPSFGGSYGSEVPGHRNEFVAGGLFAYNNSERYLNLVFLARLAGVGWSLLGGYLVYRWGQELFGPPPDASASLCGVSSRISLLMLSWSHLTYRRPLPAWALPIRSGITCESPPGRRRA